MSEVMKEPTQVKIFDTTLRDGAQSPGISLTTEQSLDIAHQLNRLGVDVIEAGFPISSQGNFEAVRAIACHVEGPVIAGLARTNPADIDKAAEAVRESGNPRIHTFISTSDIHIEHQLQTTREDVKGQTKAAVAHAKSYVDNVEFSPMDATRADIEFTAEVCEIAIAEGATTINIPDTVGYTQPDEYKEYLEQLYKLVPSLGNVVLSVHCHDDLGLAVANSFAGVQAGARQVECAVNGLGERAGNASLEEIVMLLRTRRHIDGFDTAIDAAAIGPTSRMVSSYTGYRVQKNKAIVGQNAFQHESGIHQDGILKERATFEIMSSESVGMDTDGIVLGKQSGRHAVRYHLEKEGTFKAEHFKATFGLFKEAADKIGSISLRQLVALQEEAERRQAGYYQLNEDSYFDVTQEYGTYGASIAINEEGDRRLVGSAGGGPDHPEIDGPISAIFEAIKAATDTSYHLKDYKLEAIGEGEQTIGEATVELRLNGNTVMGKGLSTNTNKAAALAYLNALSRARN